MFADDDLPKKKPPAYPPADITALSFAELKDYIEWLEAQKKLAEQTIVKKQASEKNAQSFFKS